MHCKPGQDAKIDCSHSNSNYDRIYWYKQSDQELQLLGYMNFRTANLETGVNVTMEGGASKDETCTLTISGLSLKSSAVYFCAASYTVLHISAPQYKNLHTTLFIFVLQLTASCTWNKLVSDQI